MIYISSSCLKEKYIGKAVTDLAAHGFKYIELSGGTDYYDGITSDLVRLKKRYGLTFLIHNYFPPPKDHFVINLASLDDDIYQKSIQHLLTGLALAKQLGCDRFSFHAGFYINIPVQQIGKKILNTAIADKAQAIARFCEGYRTLQTKAHGLPIYVENNVVSQYTYQEFGNHNPLMLTTYEEYQDLKAQLDFRLLLDVGHLKVTAQTLGLDFAKQYRALAAETNYLHLSDNDGTADTNALIDPQGVFWHALACENLHNKHMTFEMSADLAALKEFGQFLGHLGYG